jgi:predicted lactoylglutathione lyase
MPVPARLGIVTLGVSDLERSIAFYEALGWERCESSVPGTISWFRTADTHIGLFGMDELAEDAGMKGERPASRFGGITLAINVNEVEEVQASIDAAVAAGGSQLKPATDVGFGTSGYFADPDGHPWEVAYNSSFPPVPEDGRLHIP